MQALLITAFVFWLALSLWHFADLMQYFQLLEYLDGRFFRWSIQHWKRVVQPVEAIAGIGFLAGILVPALSGSEGIAFAALGLWIAVGGVSFWGWRKSRSTVIKPWS